MIRPILRSLAFVVVFATAASAQRQERRGFIGIGIGPSVPVGTFADASPVNPRAGRATPGYTNTFVNIGYRRGERFGIAAALSYSEYLIDDVGDDDWWQVTGVALGPMYSVPLGEKGAVDLKAMFGLMATAEIIDGFGTDGRWGNGLMIDLRSAVRYDVFRRWCVFAEVGFMSSNQTIWDGTRKDVRVLTSGLGVAFRPVW